ncbi:integrase [Rahnella aquatilis CIP 78.65 = ATCC 33071]|uniref:Site-specific recombinase XerD n=1 Tax=Rahnella aquatilis (strain ATCC 33071 / DSM 4594 / JCM 1683 / NBRC 105701 / NCIMB 13365 / CIP 78.65) TaxID=745277 RepID=H2IY66_RAHAC|nr:tyrosine-type recombinase/integrase [Rahnella aquatilis]AEX53143.1 site-specific recombinase XerD [Rahnella aquatilis CIP 78.65 = ATCC 33071]KFD04023.1 integrase [Rahnella aquatilis CIP 78.65 = ATCC 33071]
MTITKLDSGSYQVDVRPKGRAGKRIRKRFDTKGEAQQYERWVIATQNNKDWLDKPTDRRTLTEFIDLWWKYKGQSLKTGAQAKLHLMAIARDVGNPPGTKMTKGIFSDYRAEQLKRGLKPATVNKYQKLLSGVFTTLIKAGQYKDVNPMKGIDLLSKNQSEMTFLTQDQIQIFLSALTGDNLKTARLCLATGARWNEAATLSRSAVMKHKVTFINTKNGLNRTVPISSSLYDEIMAGDGNRLFPDVHYLNVRRVLKSVIPDLPDGQATHVMRHTFASHFMMNGGNILTLQKILGHASIVQTMAYAHFAPDYLNDAVRLNPLENQ